MDLLQRPLQLNISLKPVILAIAPTIFNVSEWIAWTTLVSADAGADANDGSARKDSIIMRKRKIVHKLQDNNFVNELVNQ